MAYIKVKITDPVAAVLRYGFTSAHEGMETELDEDLARSMIRMGIAEEKRKPGRPKKTEDE